jgi:signal transduction histidine kinase
LISNASQALESVTDRPRQVMLHSTTKNDGRHLQIRVEDNGEGIALENLPRLFVHGFTTRKDGHGFGLHSCALAAQGMGGSLRAESDGPGKGAAFTLELPIESGSEMR